VASLAALVERAQATRQEAQLVRSETARLSRESAVAARRLAERRQDVHDAVKRSEAVRRALPTWPAWAPPDSDELRLTLVPVE
jgi:hypothetical protein